MFYNLVSGILLPLAIIWRLSKKMPEFFLKDNRIGIDTRRMNVYKPEIHPRSQIMMKEIEKTESKTSSFIIRVEAESSENSSYISHHQQTFEIPIINSAVSSSNTEQ